jgi:hypothetical protein
MPSDHAIELAQQRADDFELSKVVKSDNLSSGTAGIR